MATLTDTVTRPEPAPPARSRWRLVTAGLVVPLVVVAGGWLAVSRERPLVSPRDAAAAAAGPSSARPGQDEVRAATVAMLFPATGIESRWTQGLDRFGQSLRAEVTRRCAAAQGVPTPDGPPPMFIPAADLPDADLLRAKGFDLTGDEAATPPPAPATEAQRPAQQACEAEGAAAAGPSPRCTPRCGPPGCARSAWCGTSRR